jgi:hypothetical protein
MNWLHFFDWVLTVMLALGLVVVLFECCFRALRDFGGFPHD